MTVEPENPYTGRLRMFAFFPYVLALGLAFIAQSLIWSFTDLGDLDSLLRISGGVLIWVMALLAIAVGDRARQVQVHGATAPWDKPDPSFLDSMLLLSLRHLGVFMLAVALVVLVAIWLPVF